MAECIYSNNINKSILTSGFTIPVDKWDIFAKCLGANLQKGERKEIVVWVGQLKCSASYTNVNLTGENAGRTVFQVRYSGDLVSELRKIFSPNSDNYDAVGGKLEVYSGKVGELTFKCLPAVTVNTINEDSAVSTTTGVMNLNTVVTKILNDYVPSKKETFAGHQMGSFFRSDIPLAIYETGIVESAPYLITGSVGQGNWAMIPWVCIFDRKITTTATKGIYIVYLLSKDGNSLYLSFNQGCTDIRKNNSKKDTIRIMREKAEDIRKRIDSRGFNADNNAKLGDGLTELGELYQEGMIFYKEYKKGNVPGESELQNDLRLMMDIYKEYVNGKAENTEIIDVEVGEEQLSTKDTLDQIKKYIAAKGFTFNEDAIVYHNGADPYERTMFGAYVLFPYANKEEYRNHKFFESIEKVNIGGLPFLPSETSMVQDMLDALIADSPDSAFERATLPRGIEDKLAKIDWNQRDVLVGALRNRAQLDTCLKYKFYHIPASKIRDADLPIHYVAIYQSINIFGREAGIRYYGEVTKTSAVKRRDIREIPKNSDEAYYRFEIKEWKELNIPLVAKEVRDFPFFTNMFLLQHCPDVPDLHISSEEEYRLYIEVRRLANDASVNETDAEPGFKYDDKTIIMENGDIVVLKDGTKIEQISIETFMRKPRESMRVIAK